MQLAALLRDGLANRLLDQRAELNGAYSARN